jgi:hypothetical protein
MAEQKEHWAIERKIPIALLTALAIQTGVWIWQSAAAWARLEPLEKNVEAMAPQGERIVRVETKTDLLIAALAGEGHPAAAAAQLNLKGSAASPRSARLRAPRPRRKVIDTFDAFPLSTPGGKRR